MKKFECNGCENHCVTTMKTVNCSPSFCLYDTIKVNWYEVMDSSEASQTTVNSEQLPAWVKVGAVGYDDINGVYFEVIEVNNDSFRAKSIGSSDSCTSLYFNEFCSEGNKRPFNEKEMCSLVGKVLETPHVDLLVNAYSKVTKVVSTAWRDYTAEDLMDSVFTLDGKPCYKLEHLNEKGEWVE